jgi:Tetratricopeptide repeat
MTNWVPAVRKKEALTEVEARLEREPERVDLHFNRACLLAETGDTERAKQAYLEVLGRAPGHLGALNNLGTLLYQTGYRTAARSAYTEAIARHPEHPMAHVNLGNIFLEAGDLAQAREHYEAALALDARLAEAHQGLGNLLAELGHEEAAARHQRLGDRDQRAIELPYRGESEPLQVLLLVSGRRGDVPIRHLLDDKVFRTFVVFPNAYDPNTPLPAHDVVFNAIGDADSCGLALDRAVTLMERTFAPVINPPAAVLGTGRAAISRRLGEIPGVVAPVIANLSREVLSSTGAEEALKHKGLRFPLLLRASGFVSKVNDGRQFQRVENAGGLEAALYELPGEELTAIQYLGEARGADGSHRKYRVMTIDGWLYPLQLTADMTEDRHRAEEEKFLRDMPGVLGHGVMAALFDIQEALGLDYAGIDFGLSPSGELLLFEANAALSKLPTGREQRLDYRRAAIQRVEDAVRNMLAAKARVTQVH